MALPWFQILDAVIGLTDVARKVTRRALTAGEETSQLTVAERGQGPLEVRGSLADVADGSRVRRRRVEPGPHPVEGLGGRECSREEVLQHHARGVDPLRLPDRLGRLEVAVDVRREQVVLAEAEERRGDAAGGLVGRGRVDHRRLPGPLLGLGVGARGARRGCRCP